MSVCRLVLFSLALILLTACIEIVDKGRPAEQPAEDRLQRAEKAFDGGDYATAAAEYRLYLTQNPASPRREALLAMAGLSCHRSGQYVQAAESFLTLVNEFPGGGYSREVRSAIPTLYLLAGQPQQAVNYAQQLLNGQTDPSIIADLRLSQARGHFSLGSYWESFVAFMQAMAGPSTDVRQVGQRGVEASLLNLPQDQLYAVARQYGQNFPGPEASWYLARAAASSGDQNLFNQRAEYFRQYFSSHPWAPKLAALTVDPNSPEAQPPGKDYDPKPQSLTINLGHAAAVSTQPRDIGNLSGLPGQVVVVALLPLTTDGSAKFSPDILAGLKLALAPISGKVIVSEIDTRGDPGEVVKQVYEIAANPSVLAVVGPLTSRESLAAAQTADSTGVPLIAISQRLGLTQERPSVFRIFLTPKHQAQAVARYAVRKLGLARFGVLYPNDLYGQAMLSFFQNEVQLLGGQVSVADNYDPSAKNWGEAVTRLTGGHSIRRASSSYQAPVDFEALYMPDGSAAINQILPLIAFNDITKMVYLGTPLWVTDDLARSSGRYLTQSVIPLAFSELSERPESVAFLNAYAAAYGKTPDQFAAYGYDAGMALMTVFSRGAGTRAEVIKALSALGPFPGATGPFSFDGQGDYQLEPTLLTVDGTSFKILEEAASSR